jgi:crotonobetainyl-CoA:carnitine CoA-transferase CaiB-like acyl-CoA transferase
VKWLGSGLGEHNKEIYGGLLGLSDKRINELVEKGVI